MNKHATRKLLKQNNITAQVITNWSPRTNRNCKFAPGDLVKVSPAAVRRAENGRYSKYASKPGIVIAASSRDGSTMRGDSRMYTRYFVAFPDLDNKVVGLHSHYLRSI